MRLHTRQLPLCTFALALAALVIWRLPWPVTEYLQYDRAAVSGGQVHRLIACHLTHFSSSHLGWDLVGFVCLGAMCELNGRGRFLGTLLLASVVIPLTVHFCVADLDTYRGLSGLVSALFGLLTTRALMRTRHDRRPASALLIALLMALFCAQMLVQSVTRQAWLVQSSSEAFVPVPMAHLAGALSGAALALFCTYPSLHRAYATYTTDA